VNRAISREQQALHARIVEAHEKIAGLEERQRAVDNELEGMAAQRQQYQLLEQVCASLDELDQLGAASLFWGEQAQSAQAHVGRVRGIASSFNEKIAVIEQGRKALQARIQDELATISDLQYAVAEQQEQEELAENEFVVHREASNVPYRAMVMPWHGEAEDERRLRKALLVALLVVFGFAFVTKIWKFTPPEEQEVVEIPAQLVKLIQKERPKPPPQEKRPEKKEELPKDTPKDTAKATPAEKQQARAKAETAGVLAFKGGFADLMQDAASFNLGADARVTTSGQKAVGDAQRSVVVAQAQAGSGGINTGSLSRDVGGTGGKVGGVQFARVESAMAGAGGNMRDANRPLSKGPGPSRTDEEVQIVFDRYKAALYRIYNRELRNDPSLRGKMILRITIESNGTVSMCKVESTDLGSPALSAEIVDRVKKFNFGPKEGVSRITILYPIDFLPAG
jgi:outer membrane biosynthesis protein TonB